MAEKKIPQIRHSRFDNEWETTKLGNIANRVTRKNSNMESTLPLTISAQYGLVDQSLFFNSQIASQNISNYYLLINGEFAYNKSTSQDYPVGAVKRLDRYDMGVLSTLYILFKPTEEISSDYLVTYFDADYWHKEIKLRAAEGARNHGLLNISPDDFFDIDLNLPKDIDEQQAIGTFLQKVDLFVSQRRDKLEKLQNLKSSMLEKMFPKDGAEVPEVRFKGFADAWKRKRFSELYESVTQKNDLTYGVDKNITVASMQYRPDIKVTDIEYLRTYNVLKLGDIAFEGHQSKEFRYGRFVENDIGDGIVSHIFAVFRPKADYDLMFWKYAINNERIMRPVLVRCTKASTMMNDLVTKDFLGESILVPDIEEQKKIGAALSEIDRLISLQREELKKLQSFKKALLEKMFV